MGILIASSVVPWDAGDALAYHVLSAATIAVGGGLLLVGLTARSMSRFLPRQDARHGVFWIGLLILGLAWRGIGMDPAWPAWSVAGTATVVLLYGVLAVWAQSPGCVYLSGLLVNATGILIWWSAFTRDFGFVPTAPWGPGVVDELLAVNIICFAIGSGLWSASALILRSLTPPIDVRGRWPAFSHAAVLMGLNLLAILVGAGVFGGLGADAIRISGPLTWLALAATVAALAVCAWDPDAGFTPAALYMCGLMALGLFIHRTALSWRAVAWWATWMLAGYVLMTSVAGWLSPRLTRLKLALRLPDTAMNWPEAWFLSTQAVVGTVAGLLGVWTVLTFDNFADRATGVLSIFALVAAGVTLTGAVSGRWGAACGM